MREVFKLFKMVAYMPNMCLLTFMLNICIFTKNKIMCQPWLLFIEIFGQSDSEEDDFEGFNVVDGVELINNETVELNEDQRNEIIEEIEAEERNAKYEAYDCEWLQNFTSPFGSRNVDEDSSPLGIISRFIDIEVLTLLVNKTNRYYEQYVMSVGGIENQHR